MTSLGEVLIERCPHFRVGVSLFQWVRIEGLHYIQRCPYFRVGVSLFQGGGVLISVG